MLQKASVRSCLNLAIATNWFSVKIIVNTTPSAIRIEFRVVASPVLAASYAGTRHVIGGTLQDSAGCIDDIAFIRS